MCCVCSSMHIYPGVCACVYMCTHVCACVHTHPYTTRASLLHISISCKGVYLPNRLTTSCDRTTQRTQFLQNTWSRAGAEQKYNLPVSQQCRYGVKLRGSPTQASCWQSPRDGPAMMSQSCSTAQGSSAWALVPSRGDHPLCGGVLCSVGWGTATLVAAYHSQNAPPPDVCATQPCFLNVASAAPKGLSQEPLLSHKG